jgi:hypothetical protein
MYDLQHAPGVTHWSRGHHWFLNDLDHRTDAVTCGMLSRDLAMEMRGLAFRFLLLVWLRDGTWVNSVGPGEVLTEILAG